MENESGKNISSCNHFSCVSLIIIYDCYELLSKLAAFPRQL